MLYSAPGATPDASAPQKALPSSLQVQHSSHVVGCTCVSWCRPLLTCVVLPLQVDAILDADKTLLSRARPARTRERASASAAALPPPPAPPLPPPPPSAPPMPKLATSYGTVAPNKIAVASASPVTAATPLLAMHASDGAGAPSAPKLDQLASGGSKVLHGSHYDGLPTSPDSLVRQTSKGS